MIISLPNLTLATECITQYEREELARMLYGEDRSSDFSVLGVMRKAAVVQVVLNRLDAWGGSLFDGRNAIVRRSQFHGYLRSNPVETWALDIVNRVCDGWEMEQRGEKNGWMVLPHDFLYFGSTGSRVNKFRDRYNPKSATYWDFDNLAGDVWLNWEEYLSSGDDASEYG